MTSSRCTPARSAASPPPNRGSPRWRRSCSWWRNGPAMPRETPELLERAWALDWSEAVTLLTPAESLYVIGRGPGLAVAQEAALKFKETCGLHAEAISAAELRHGPMA